MPWGKQETRQQKSDPILFAQQRDPDLCFVLFPSANLTALSAAVSLESLLLQVRQQPAARQIETISYDPQARRIDIHFVPSSQNK
ncbi:MULTISPECIES: hypothetical protein [Paenibacillus]|uniref:Uncharacterized protein n=1 Tax=Paenibacillus macerans TaxID=44252 RepID=A0A090Z7P5_PAEMA|nr:hypothetical protein [Paenibacillus macerans]KFN07294.1 hypothetical protein DJ90_5683 [Paenibacillus macerans]MCY7558238.1 hypothetical protein [Paenibacillus macerans]MEC0154624.1 hypothetical protein [Paenibacillus macerans]SUA85644.1 Uncharacterised protein [Paenibacillus macerans]